MLVSAGQWLQSLLENKSRHEPTASQWLTIPTSFEAPSFLHALYVVCSPTKHRGMKLRMMFLTETWWAWENGARRLSGTSCSKRAVFCRRPRLSSRTSCSMRQKRPFLFSCGVSSPTLCWCDSSWGPVREARWTYRMWFRGRRWTFLALSTKAPEILLSTKNCTCLTGSSAWFLATACTWKGKHGRSSKINELNGRCYQGVWGFARLFWKPAGIREAKSSDTSRCRVGQGRESTAGRAADAKM